MEHIVQFGICIDDEAIRQRIEEKAEREIKEAMLRQIEDVFFETRYGRRVGYEMWVKDKVDAFFQENRDELIALAADRVAERIVRTKAGREMLERAEKSV